MNAQQFIGLCLILLSPWIALHMQDIGLNVFGLNMAIASTSYGTIAFTGFVMLFWSDDEDR